MFCEEESLSKYLVRNGYAFAYRRYSKKFIEDEEYAKENQLGLWSMTLNILGITEDKSKMLNKFLRNSVKNNCNQNNTNSTNESLTNI